MTVKPVIETVFAPGIRVVEQLVTMSQVSLDDWAVAICNRCIPPEITHWVDTLPVNLLPRARLILKPQNVKDALQDVFDVSGTPTHPERVFLIEDISDLAQQFSCLMGVRQLRPRLDVVESNACRRFHVDAVWARLICTYRGTGTQFGISENSEAPDPIYTVPTGAPIVLRGSLGRRAEARTWLHRSPPIEGTGETRLVLVLDPVFDDETGL